MAAECKRYHSRLAELLATKKGESYSTTMSWIRARVSFALLSIFLLKQVSKWSGIDNGLDLARQGVQGFIIQVTYVLTKESGEDSLHCSYLPLPDSAHVACSKWVELPINLPLAEPLCYLIVVHFSYCYMQPSFCTNKVVTVVEVVEALRLDKLNNYSFWGVLLLNSKGCAVLAKLDWLIVKGNLGCWHELTLSCYK